MIINAFKVIEIFCELDDFVTACEQCVAYKFIGSESPHSVHIPGISAAEMMCIEVLYHLSGYKCFQYYYEQEVEQGALSTYFPKAPSYSRFVQLKPRVLTLMVLYLNCCRVGQLIGIYYADATSLAICHNRRIHTNKVFKGKVKLSGERLPWAGFMALNSV